MKNIWKIYNQDVNRLLEYLGFTRRTISKDNRYFDFNGKEVFSSPLLYMGTRGSEILMIHRYKDADYIEFYDLEGNFLKIKKK